MPKAVDVVNPNAKTSIQVTVAERSGLTETAARTAELDGMSKLSVRELVNKMHAHWKQDLTRREMERDADGQQ